MSRKECFDFGGEGNERNGKEDFGKFCKDHCHNGRIAKAQYLAYGEGMLAAMELQGTKDKE